MMFFKYQNDFSASLSSKKVLALHVSIPRDFPRCSPLIFKFFKINVTPIILNLTNPMSLVFTMNRFFKDSTVASVDNLFKPKFIL